MRIVIVALTLLAALAGADAAGARSVSDDWLCRSATGTIESTGERTIQLALTACCEGPYYEDQKVCTAKDSSGKCTAWTTVKVKKCKKHNPGPCATD